MMSHMQGMQNEIDSIHEDNADLRLRLEACQAELEPFRDLMTQMRDPNPLGDGEE